MNASGNQPPPDPVSLGTTLPGGGPPSMGANPPPSSRPRVTIPGFEILAELGRGGMGVVYKARQLDLGREVALKMVLAGAHASPETLIRFQIEAEAVARLDHENIVKVHQIGAHDGCPFFTLEFLSGGTLAGKLARQPQPQREAAQTVALLAAAMQRAHAQGIIHRDLKPTNILLSVSGIPKIADFGLAKRFQEEKGYTVTGATLGTPGYLSPEQARGDNNAGPATDIYALGAILYEMLTGRPPFTGASPTDVILRVLRDEVISPAYHRPGISRDLETVCLKCLEKEPAKRYASAADLAQDLRAFLEGRPVTARPVGPAVRALKWARRHPTATVFFAALTAALAVSLWGGVWYAQDQRRQAESERKLRRQALDAVDANLTQVSESRLLQVPGLQPLRRELLDSALRYYQNFINEQSGDPALRHDLAAAFFRVAGIESAIGSTEKAVDNYEKALLIQRELAARQPRDPALRAALATTLGRLANLRIDLGQNAAARPAYEEARAIGLGLSKEDAGNGGYTFETARNTLNLAILESMEGHEDRFESLVSSVISQIKAPASLPPEDRNLFATALTNQAAFYRNKDRLDEAQAAIGRALALQRKLCAELPAAAEYQSRLAKMLDIQATIAAAKNDTAGSLKSLEESLQLRKALAAANPSVIAYQAGLAESYDRIAAARHKAGQETEAVQAQLEAIKITEQLAAANPSVFTHQTNLAAEYGDYAQALAAQDRPADSLDWYRKSLAVLGPLAEKHPDNAYILSDLAATSHNAAIASGKIGLIDQARQFYENSAHTGSLAVALSPRDEAVARDAAQGWIILSQFLSVQQEYPDAETAGKTACVMLEKWRTNGSPETLLNLASARNNLGRVETELGDAAKLNAALADFAAAREISARLAAQSNREADSDLVWIDLNRAIALRLLDRLPEAASLLDATLSRAAALSGGENGIPAPFLAERGALRLAQGHPDAACQDLETALQRLKLTPGDYIAAGNAAAVRSTLLLAQIAAGHPQAVLNPAGESPPPILTLRRAEALFALGKAAEAGEALRLMIASASPARKAWLHRAAARDQRLLDARKRALPAAFAKSTEEW